MLMRQQAENEQELELAQPTDFASPETGEVSIGTIVSLKDADSGDTEQYTILGAWDSDPDKRIVAYLTDVGQQLLGSSIGETVDLPTGVEGGTKSFEVTGIEAYNKA